MAGLVKEMTAPVGVEAQAPVEPVVVTVDLEKRYGADVRPALAGVSLAVGRGRFLSIMGPSGSGKSTLLHLIGGLDRPSGGQVILEGQRLDTLKDSELTEVRRRVVGVVFQAYNLVPVLTAAENVALPLMIGGRRGPKVDAAVREALEVCGLAEKAGRLPSQMSGGEQQRTAIARALVGRPRVLLADEPTGNLDSATGQSVLRMMREAQKELDCTVVMVTHDPKVAATGDEVLNLRDGQVAGRLDLRRGRARRPVDRIVSWLADGEPE